MGSIQAAAERARAAGSHPAPGRRGSHQHRDRRAGRRLAADGHYLARPVCPPRAGRIARPAPAGTTPEGRSRPPGRDLSVTLNPAPPRLGITHWSTRFLARELGVSRDTIARIWREYGIQPWRAETFTFSTDPSWRPRSTTSSAWTGTTGAGRGALCGREVPDSSLGACPARALRLARAARAAHP
jgi:hypothetical protein